MADVWIPATLFISFVWYSTDVTIMPEKQMLPTENTFHTQKQNLPPLWHLGFRPFFMAAGGVAVLSMLLWSMMYARGWSVPTMSGGYWHAHEMIFGYAIATIVGFLLTATKNWTQIQTVYGWPLRLLVFLWLSARFLPWVGASFLPYQAIIDVAFLWCALLAIATPIIQAKQWQQLGILAKLFLLAVAHSMFYLGVLGLWQQGLRLGLYLGFYLVLSLILMMLRRLLPFFIERGIEEDNVQLKNSKWLDIASLVLVAGYMWVALFSHHVMIHFVALVLFLIHVVRMYFWYHRKIWQKPLLWSLYLAYAFIVVGFGIKALQFFVPMPPNIAEHSFALGIGLVTLSMMARVSLGHTGRNVFRPPKMVTMMFLLLVGAFVLRVLLPLVAMELYTVWVLLAQILWLGAFILFLWVYTPMFIRPRRDGKFG